MAQFCNCWWPLSSISDSLGCSEFFHLHIWEDLYCDRNMNDSESHPLSDLINNVQRELDDLLPCQPKSFISLQAIDVTFAHPTLANLRTFKNWKRCLVMSKYPNVVITIDTACKNSSRSVPKKVEDASHNSKVVFFFTNDYYGVSSYFLPFINAQINQITEIAKFITLSEIH